MKSIIVLFLSAAVLASYGVVVTYAQTVQQHTDGPKRKVENLVGQSGFTLPPPPPTPHSAPVSTTTVTSPPSAPPKKK